MISLFKKTESKHNLVGKSKEEIANAFTSRAIETMEEAKVGALFAFSDHQRRAEFMRLVDQAKQLAQEELETRGGEMYIHINRTI